MGDRSTKRVFLDISIDGQKEGRIIIELFDKIAPRTCENFRALCNGDYGKVQNVNMTYRGSPFHRVVKNFMIQGGDITAGNGTGGMSIYGRTFDDEEFMESHSEPYLLSMANRGPNTNSSQFFITTAIARHLDTKHVVFGRVVKGKELVDKIEKIRVNEASKPFQDVMISSCGELFKKSKPDAQENERAQSVENGEEEKVEEPEISTVKAEDLPPEPKTRNWLLRRSRSRSQEKKEDYSKDRKKRRSKSREHKRRRDDSRDRRRRDDSRDRRRDSRRRRSRTRSRSPLRRSPDRSQKKDRHDRDNGVKVKGRGAIRFQRDTTPPHWKKEERKKTTLEDYQNRIKKEEEDERLRLAAEKKKELEQLERDEIMNRKKVERDDSDSDEQENDESKENELDEYEDDDEAVAV